MTKISTCPVRNDVWAYKFFQLWGEPMKSKGMYLLVGLLVFFGLGGIFLAISLSNIGASSEDTNQQVAETSSNTATDGLAEADQWMIRYIDPPGNVDPKKVYTFECELISQRPDELTTTCADFGAVVYKIKWTTWTVNGAEGSGIYSVNNCSPDCADGTRHEVRVKVYLSDVTTDGKNYFLKIGRAHV